MATTTLNVDEVLHFVNDFLIHDDDKEEIYDESSPNGCLCHFRIKQVQQKSLLQNESKLLQNLVATCNGKPTTPIRNFSEKELRHATDNYDPQLVLHRNRSYVWYRGSLDDGQVFTVRKNKRKQDWSSVYPSTRDIAFSETSTDKNNIFKVVRQCDALNEIAFSAKMSAHKNILKVVGCCIETPIPIVVFEPFKKGTLRSRIFGSDSNTFPPHQQTMAWPRKLRVATQIANAIAYIHTAFSTPIIHMLIDPSNIFFDQKDVPKLFGFSYSISIPEGETQAKSCLFGKLLMEKYDVLFFGILLLELLTGKRAWDLSRGEEDTVIIDYVRNRTINEIVDLEVLAGEGAVAAGLKQQMQAVRELALTCTEDNPKDRPTMVDVTKELGRIETLVP